MSEDLAQRIRNCPSLPSLPAIAMRVLDLARNEQIDLNELADVISQDPAISGKILRTVNSSFYGRSQSIGTISHALVLLGLQSVKTLVLGFSLVHNLSARKPDGFSHIAYWRRSIYGATAARVLCNKLGIVQQEECFLAALLQDIGMLVLDQVLGKKYGEICAKASAHSELAAIETEVLGMTHADVSGILAEQWQLPPLLREPMARHHRAHDVADPGLRKLAEVVAMAGRCADVFVQEQAAEPIARFRKFCQEQYNIPEADCDAMLEDVCTRTREVAGLFEIAVDDVSYESILRRANEALVSLTLTTQQHAARLEVEKQELLRSAMTDPLTGLANRGRFDGFISEQWALCVQAEDEFGQINGERVLRPLSLLLMDVDHFKSINDTYGHAAGDQVLRVLGRLLKAATRAQHMAFRYGGEELALVMPGTTRATAAATAESIRRAISARPVNCGGTPVSVTVSVGVASLEAGAPFEKAEQLFKAADSALYAAKRAGRNRVKLFTPKPLLPRSSAA